ncbi:SapC family protein [Asticcacaulis machinosus]|uniref:SapC family protein n=1 Tax=Asticcacaulis machinosus TaxID=2984211 RepID=A0ABT5HJX9_9CAUL|nr:SapC family protein [Asticcacaulis machinosus]MDC7676313.1 SapC family protein [Asticcacaulis machinosus]
MEQTPLADAQLTGSVLFYKTPEPLSPELHANLGISASSTPHAFVAETNVVPLTVAEFPAAALSYPIVFIGESRMPVAAMGLTQGQNVFVSDAGVFRSDAYLPAFARRYPFVFANDEGQERMILCVDTGASMVTTNNPDVPFFENGAASPFVENAMKFCTDFETERRRTESFVNLLKEYDLLSPRETVYRPQNPDGTPGEPQKIAEYFGVDEEKLNALPADKLVALRDNGALTHIYAHLISLLAWDKLIALTIERGNAPANLNS